MNSLKFVEAVLTVAMSGANRLKLNPSDAGSRCVSSVPPEFVRVMFGTFGEAGGRVNVGATTGASVDFIAGVGVANNLELTLVMPAASVGGGGEPVRIGAGAGPRKGEARTEELGVEDFEGSERGSGSGSGREGWPR